MLFDFDGTIANTFPSIIAILNRLAPEYGYRTASPEELPALRSLTPRQLAERMGLSWHQVPLLAVRVRKEMARNMNTIEPFDGIADALDGLRKRGVRLGMLTSNSRENVELFLANRPELQFHFVSTGSGLFGKHHRLKRLLQREQLAPADAYYVGDETRDIEAAQAVGMRMIAVTWGFSSLPPLAALKPDHVIDSPAQLLTVL